jgi:hypothetical protein
MGYRGGFYSGLILLAPTKPVKQLILAPPEAAKAALAKIPRRPLEIEFDGVYRYFQPPDRHPQPDAPIVHGNLIKNAIFSTDNEPVRMVANQVLNQAVPIACCRALRLEIIDSINTRLTRRSRFHFRALAR